MIRILKKKTNKFYIATAIPYANAEPHVGHALEYVQADTIARYNKTRGK
jgi:methionyl-tRNA synthetase